MTDSVDTIKQSSRKVYFTITGGGSYAVSKLLMSGGASNVFVGANIPYAEKALDHVIGTFKRKNVSEDVATYLALESKDHSDDIGVGVTCKLIKDNERKGREHLVYMSITDRKRTVNFKYVPKGLYRFEQEFNVGNWILDGLATFIGEREPIG